MRQSRARELETAEQTNTTPTQAWTYSGLGPKSASRDRG
jgi:hypothetical protein